MLDTLGVQQCPKQFQMFPMSQKSRGNVHPEATDNRSLKALPADPAIPAHWNAPP